MRCDLTPDGGSTDSNVLPHFNNGRKTMDELRQLIGQYDPYYEMSDDSKTWHRGSQIDRRIRALAAKLRGRGYGPEIDALMIEHPGLISSPGAAHVLV